MVETAKNLAKWCFVQHMERNMVESAILSKILDCYYSNAIGDALSNKLVLPAKVILVVCFVQFSLLKHHCSLFVLLICPMWWGKNKMKTEKSFLISPFFVFFFLPLTHP